MVEAGFTRAKNAGNIIMKNLMDFCIGTFMFFLIGASLLLGNDMGGFIGKLDFNIFSHYGNYDYSIFVQQRRSFPVPWQNVQNSFPTVFTPL